MSVVEFEEAVRASEETRVSTARLAAVGLGLTVMIALLMPEWVIRFRGDTDSGRFLPLVPVATTLFVLALRSFLPGRPWSNNELLGLFCILLIGISGMGLIGRLIAILPSA